MLNFCESLKLNLYSKNLNFKKLIYLKQLKFLVYESITPLYLNLNILLASFIGLFIIKKLNIF